MNKLHQFSRCSREQRICRLLASIMAISIMFFPLFGIPAKAAGGVDFEGLMQLKGYIVQNTTGNSGLENGYSFDGFHTNGTADDWEDPKAADTTNLTAAPTWGELLALASQQNNIASDYPKLKSCCATANQVVSTFKSSAEYNKALADVLKINWTYDATTRILKPNAAGDQHALDNAVTRFKSLAAGAAADNAFSSIYDSQEWNPSEGVAGDFLISVYGVVNTIFFVVSNLMLWFFLLQTGFDALYIIAEPVRPFIGPMNKGGGGMGLNNGAGGGNFLSKIHVPICSHAVEQACNGEGGLGGNNGGGRSAGNAFFSYALKRFPVLICCAVYLILVTLGYWPKLISWVSQFAIQIIDFIMRVGQ